jgi:hypothetical protein
MCTFEWGVAVPTPTHVLDLIAKAWSPPPAMIWKSQSPMFSMVLISGVSEEYNSILVVENLDVPSEMMGT